MPAGTTFLTKTLDRINTICTGYTLFTGAPLWQGLTPRVFRGYTRFQDTDNFEAFAPSMAQNGTQACFSFWLKDATVATLEVYPCTVLGELVFAIDPQSNNDLNAQWDAALNFVVALNDPTSYTGAGEIPPSKIRFALHEVDVTKRQGLVIFDFGNYGHGGIEFPDP